MEKEIAMEGGEGRLILSRFGFFFDFLVQGGGGVWGEKKILEERVGEGHFFCFDFRVIGGGVVEG